MSKVKEVRGGKLVGVKTSIYTIFNQEKYDPKAIPTAWREFFSQVKEHSQLQSAQYFGATIPNMDFDAPMDYFAGAIVPRDTEVPVGLESVEVPTGNYFVFVHTGSIMNIADSYQSAYALEFPAANLKMRPAPHLEIYNPELDPLTENYTMEIAIPV